MSVKTCRQYRGVVLLGGVGGLRGCVSTDAL